MSDQPKDSSAGFVVTYTLIDKKDLPAFLEGMNEETREWEMAAARGECGWICADCCASFPRGMSDECAWGHASCTAIIQRDKAAAQR